MDAIEVINQIRKRDVRYEVGINLSAACTSFCGGLSDLKDIPVKLCLVYNEGRILCFPPGDARDHASTKMEVSATLFLWERKTVSYRLISNRWLENGRIFFPQLDIFILLTKIYNSFMW